MLLHLEDEEIKAQRFQVTYQRFLHICHVTHHTVGKMQSKYFNSDLCFSKVSSLNPYCSSLTFDTSTPVCP